MEVEAVDELNAMTISPDGRFLAAGCGDGTALIWEIATGSQSPPLVGHLSGVTKVQFSPDSRTLLTCSQDGTARMWNTITGQEMVSEVPMNTLLMNHVWLHPLFGDADGIIEAAGQDRVRIRRLATLEEIDASISQIDSGQPSTRL
jgi:WD40 repeat protein